MTKTVIAAALGECVHVAGITNFLRLAEMRRLEDYLSRACCLDRKGH
jgi:hypothetical protein